MSGCSFSETVSIPKIACAATIAASKNGASGLRGRRAATAAAANSSSASSPAM